MHYEAIPEMEVIATWGGSCWILQGTCPYCGEKHSHGGGVDVHPARYGHRLAHCCGPVVDNDGYVLIPKNEGNPHEQRGPRALKHLTSDEGTGR
jgi:hypothetical protein